MLASARKSLLRLRRAPFAFSRSETSVVFAALLALLALSSGGAGAGWGAELCASSLASSLPLVSSLPATQAPASCQAVLLWIEQNLSTPNHAQRATVQAEVSAPLAIADASTHAFIERAELRQCDGAATSHAPIVAFPVLPVVFSITSAPRKVAPFASLHSHEAARLSGVRTNSPLE